MATIFMYFVVAFFMVLLLSLSILNIWMRNKTLTDLFYNKNSIIDIKMFP